MHATPRSLGGKNKEQQTGGGCFIILKLAKNPKPNKHRTVKNLGGGGGGGGGQKKRGGENPIIVLPLFFNKQEEKLWASETVL